jgi:probable rRNA maturation factor
MKSTRRGARSKVGRPVLSLSVQYGVDPAALPQRGRFRRWVVAALREDAEVTVRVVGTAEGRRLNRIYRGRDYGTNVLTFNYGGVPLHGDIVLCAPVVRREAREQGKPLEAHYAHLVVHGVLHLQGHDHERDADARVMEALETQIVAGLGYADPNAENG